MSEKTSKINPRRTFERPAAPAPENEPDLRPESQNESYLSSEQQTADASSPPAKKSRAKAAPKPAGKVKAPSKKVGRPKKPGGRMSLFPVYLYDDERDAVRGAAADAGTSASEWARAELLRRLTVKP